MSALRCEPATRSSGRYSAAPRNWTITGATFGRAAAQPVVGDARLSRLRRLPANWDGRGAPAPSPLAIDTCERLLAAFERSQVQALVTGGVETEPSVEGGVALTMRRGDRGAHIELCNNGEAFLVLMQPGTQSRVEPVTPEDREFARTLEAVRAHLG